MPSASIRVSILIDAAPESVFAYVSDLTCHAERRQLQFQANLLQWLTHLLVVYPVRIPSARRTLQLLKHQIELHSRLREDRDRQ